MMNRKRAILLSLVVLVAAVAAGLFAYPEQKAAWFPWRQYTLGLDIAGGTSLTYIADLSAVAPENRAEAMEGLKDVIERRADIHGVKEPRVEIARQAGEWRLLVDIAGIKDANEAIRMIGDTPFLEFRRECTEEERQGIAADELCFVPTPLTGKYLERAELVFNEITREPMVLLAFDADGTNIFADLTRENLGRPLAIYLDGAPISIPVVQEVIPTGEAQITGQFTFHEARTLVRRLNEGALPVPIDLVSQRTIGATLGREALATGVRAGIIGLLAVAVFMMFFYRGAGACAALALCVYVLFALAIFKAIPVTLTLAGIAGFILSIGMAVDANILIFERTKEELRKGRQMQEALRNGFSRAWTSIRDANVTTIISAVILYTFATSIIRGFALTLLIGVLISMFSAVTVTRFFLASVVRESPRWWFGIRTSSK